MNELLVSVCPVPMETLHPLQVVPNSREKGVPLCRWGEEPRGFADCDILAQSIDSSRVPPSPVRAVLQQSIGLEMSQPLQPL